MQREFYNEDHFFCDCYLLFLNDYASAAKGDRQPVFELKLDSSWKCTREGTEHVCEKGSGKDKALLIWTAKEVGTTDSFDKYFEHLKNPIKRKIGKNKSLVSDPHYTRMTNIEGRQWIDSLHWQAEMPNYYTRYLATAGDQTAVMVTVSAKKNSFDKVNSEIQPAIERMKLTQ
jgi:hypothetical protein